jgi:acyl-CoA thioester hydrolase
MTAALCRSGTIEAGVHRLLTTVYYEDTDAAGIVYHANYLKFAERARTELLRLLGFGQEQLRREHGLAFAVRRCLADYRGAARLDDELAVESRLTALGGASLEVEQVVRRGQEVLVRLELKLACLGRGLKPARIPPPLRAALATLMQPDRVKNSDAA